MFRTRPPKDGPRSVVAPPDEPRPEMLRPGRRVAVLVAHGMGQQVRFETLDDLAGSLLAAAGEAGGQPPVTVRMVDYGGQRFARVEIGLRSAAGAPLEVHLYEAYWAPLTAGAIHTGEVLLFLLSAGWQALRRVTLGTGSPLFTRLMFGDWQRFSIGWRTPAALLGVVALLAALGAIYLLALTVLVSRFLGAPFASHEPAGWVWVSAAVLALGVPARWFIHEFVGDVVIYVSSYKVSRFQAVRDAIQKAALDVARCVYGLRDCLGRPAYERVVVVGHSLGSVIAYDTLNAVLREDPAPFGPEGAVTRTGALLTFGSPLDTTAFVFRSQRREAPDEAEFVRGEGDAREALAAAVQPLIADYRFRPRRWLNVWSPMDPVSAALKYYDVTGPNRDRPGFARYRERFVENRVDPEARKPLFAHLQYWRNRMLARELFNEVIRPD